MSHFKVKKNSYEKWKKINHECMLSNGKCVFCGEEGVNPHDNEPAGLLPGEINLSPQYQKIFDFAVNYANKWDMFMRGMYKPTLIELDQFVAEGLTIRLDESGKIINVKKAGKIDKKLVKREDYVEGLEKLREKKEEDV
ncbi:hypothetical protein LCGC14_1646820 [marine sediment metagenome]|uniref:Uncharacterized protein n=1 Tax=marine sediment metagenome TaxID=412755 RepID=A0A0F9HYR0_9ZZZZ